jgi:hypothetical protein
MRGVKAGDGSAMTTPEHSLWTRGGKRGQPTLNRRVGHSVRLRHGSRDFLITARTVNIAITDVRSVAELERWFPVADLEPDGLSLAA